jgi:tetratricopeptide (TPR) repeat protein
MEVNKILMDVIKLQNNFEFNEAEKLLKKALKKSPSNPNILTMFADTSMKRNHFNDAIKYYKKSIELFSNQPHALNNCGVCYLNLQLYDQAIHYFSLAINSKTDELDFIFNKAYASQKSGKEDDAINLYKSILEIDKYYLSSYLNIATIQINNNLYFEAYESLSNYIELNKVPDAIAYQERAHCSIKMGHFDDAIHDLSISINVNPLLPEAFNSRGNLYLEKVDYANAIKDFDQAISLNPNFALAYNNRGLLFLKKEEYDLALNNFNKALLLKSNEPQFYKNRIALFIQTKSFSKALLDSISLLSLDEDDVNYKSRADIFVAMGNLDEAIRDLTLAIKFNPSRPTLYCDSAALYEAQGNFIKAEEDYNQPANDDLKPSLEQRFGLSLLNLSQKKFDIGWRGYALRKERLAHEPAKLVTSKPLWHGESDIGILYISNEQGVGDQILHTSFLSEVLERNTKIILSIDPRLKQIYQRSFPSIILHPVNIEDKSHKFLDESLYDYQIPMGDLAGIFRNTLDSFINQKIAFLKPDKDKTENYKKVIKGSKKIACGISWKSKSAFGDQKSFSLDAFSELLEKDYINFVNLQYGEIKDEIKLLRDHHDIEISDFSDIDKTNDLDSLISLIDACDFVITSSNVTAHLSGAIGKKTYLIAPIGKAKIFYWHDNNDACLWYPSVKVINQKRMHGWKDQIKEVKMIIEREYEI